MRELPQLSDAPEGSRANPDSPGLEIIGTVATASGPIEIVLEQQRVAYGGPIWLFSRATLQAVPSTYDEIVVARNLRGLPPPHDHTFRRDPPARVGNHAARPGRGVSDHETAEPSTHGAAPAGTA
jgi:hypothetical protein